jgi:hypothetical protein
MSTTRSDDRNNSSVAYKRTVREYLRTHGEVASKNEIRAGTDAASLTAKRHDKPGLIRSPSRLI